MVMSCRPSKDGIEVLTSTMIYIAVSFSSLRTPSDPTLSAIWINSGDAPTDAPGIMPPSSVIAVASTITTSSFLLGRSLV